MAFPLSIKRTTRLNSDEIGISSEKYILRKVEEEIETVNLKIVEFSDNEIILKRKIFYHPGRFLIRVELKKNEIQIETISNTYIDFSISLAVLISMLIFANDWIFSLITGFWIFFIYYSESFKTLLRISRKVENLKNKYKRPAYNSG